MGKNKNEEKKKKDDIDISQYDKFSGISHRELNIGLWIAKNKKKFIISIIVILILLSAGFFLYSGYHYAYYFLEGKEYDEKLAQDLSNYDNASMEYRLNNPLDSLEIKYVHSYKTEDKIDLVSEIHNPNGRYYANFEYCFVDGETEILCDEDFVFPLEDKHLIALALDENVSQNLNIRLSSVSWSRIDAHKYPDWSKYYNDHLDFKTENIRFRPARQSPLSDKMSLDVLEFDIKNNTAYSYWEVPLNIVLYNNSRIVGVYKHTLNEFLTGTNRSVRLVWPGTIVQADEIKITPRLNIIDPDIYIKY
ncbi:hypothetical protein K9M50_01490 [Patescibacteria group bacterium]|nr:hypothetical protein [Patescibacteria group bacterium]